VTSAVCSLPIQFAEPFPSISGAGGAARIDHVSVGHCIVRSRLPQSRPPTERRHCVTQRGDDMAEIVLAVAPGMLYFHASRQWLELMSTRTPLTVRECLGASGSTTAARCSRKWSLLR
jgi:hypothetical protein